MKVLVIGGTKYFGRHLIANLLNHSCEVFVFTRSKVGLEFNSPIVHIKGDRKNKEELSQVKSHGPFDIVFDQVCMSGKEALEACEIFNGITKRYIMTSTGSVYHFSDGVELSEEIFDAKNYPLNVEDTNPYNYQEAKRQAEAIFLNQASFEVACVRFPIVLGTDDYTSRLKFHVDKIKNNEALFFPNINIKMAFVESWEAGHFLSFLGLKSSYVGSVNAASSGYISLLELVTLIELKTHKKVALAEAADETNHSPFGADKDFMMPNKKAESLGFKFQKLNDYLPKLVEFFSS